MTSTQASAVRLLTRLRERPPTLGRTRLLCIDGPAGAGKSTVAAAVGHISPDALVVHLDDLYDGWDGLPRLSQQLTGLLEPLARGQVGTYRRYDWLAREYAERVPVDPVPELVVEGVGAGSASIAHLTTLLAWVAAPPEVCWQRWLARDGSDAAAHRAAWQEAESAYFERDRVAVRADVVIDGVSGTLRESGPP